MGQWFRVDLHIHLPDRFEQDPGAMLRQALRAARNRSLDLIGLVDHHAVRGYEYLRMELSRLAVLEETSRLSPEEETAWNEYRALLSELLVLPGFELTAADGRHLLALFPPETPVERLHGLLLNLGIPLERLKEGSPEIVARCDLPTACLLVERAGGIAIGEAAEWPWEEGATETYPPGLLALEAETPPERSTGRSLTLLSSGEFCRRRCAAAPEERPGRRYTELDLPERSFAALRDLLLAGEGERVRFPLDRIRQQVQEAARRGDDRLILYDPADPPDLAYRHLAALANAGGGVILIGLNGEEVVGVEDPETWSSTLLRQAREQVEPSPHLTLELVHYEGKEVIRVEVRADDPPPYLTSEGVVYIRREGQTRPANREALLSLLQRERPARQVAPTVGLDLPQAGVEIVGAYLRDGTWFYTIRDLRVTSDVTRQRARGLWGYAIDRHEALRQGRVDLSSVRWKQDWGVWRAYRSGERRTFDLVHRDAGGQVHIFYGVSEWGLPPVWQEVVESLHVPLEEERTERRERPERREEAEPARPRPPVAPQRAKPPAGSPSPPRQVRPPQQPVEERPSPRAERGTAPSPKPAPAGGPGKCRPRWRGQAAVERVYWEGGTLYFDLMVRQGEGVRRYPRIRREQLLASEGWLDLVRVPRPPTGVEVAHSTPSGDEVLYQFREIGSGRIDPRVRRESDFAPDSPEAHAIRMFHQDSPLDESQVRWWGNIGYLRILGDRVDLVYRDEEGRDHLYYAAERPLLEGEWRELLRIYEQEEANEPRFSGAALGGDR